MNRRKKQQDSKTIRKVQDLNENSEQQSEIFQVEKILNKKIKGGVQYYLVSWKGYKQSEATWQPKQNMTNCPSLILEYELSHLPQKAKNDLAITIQEEEALLKSPQTIFPPNIFDYNMDIVKPDYTLFSIRQNQAFLKSKIQEESAIKDGVEIQEIIQCESQRDSEGPSWYRVLLKDGQLKRLSREAVLSSSHNKIKVIQYYEGLIRWSD